MKKFRIIIASLIIFGISSCNLLDTEPEDFTSPSNFYKNEKEALMALTGVYTTLGEMYADKFSLQVASSDDLGYYDRDPITLGEMPVLNNVTSTSDPTSYSIWSALYKGISNANLFLENIDKADMNEDTKKSFIGEVIFLRAYYHFMLAQLYGDVPYRTETFKNIYEQDMAGTQQTEVIKKAVEDIESIIPDLLEIDDNKLKAGHISRSAARGVLARMYLKLAGWPSNLGKPMYEKALFWATEVNADSKHGLNREYRQVFINLASDQYDIKESIWEVEFKGNRLDGHESTGRLGNTIGIYNPDMTAESHGYCYGFMSITLNLWDMYNDLDSDQMPETAFIEGKIGAMPSEKNHPDMRRDWNIAPYVFASNEKSYYRYKGDKYIDKNGDEQVQPRTVYVTRNAGKYRREYEIPRPRNKNHTPINAPLLRYSDVLLMIAEAANEVNAGPTPEAVAAMKEVRARSLGPYDRVNYSAIDYEGFKQLVKDERGRELCFEFLRKYDLIRWGDYSAEMMKVVQYVSSDDRWDKTKVFAATTARPVVGTKRHWWLPIPMLELSQNRALKQNPLW